VSAAIGRSVRLFLVDGKSTGLITAEIMNWTGHVLTGPRTELPKFLARPEVERTGVYLLHGRDPDNPDDLVLYIGESDRVASRLKGHSQDEGKTFWERTCVITSKDQNLTKAHVRYLEARLIGIAKSAARARLTNGTEPPLIVLPEADRSDMEYFIEQIRLILPVLGLEFLRESPKPSQQPSTSPASPDAQGPVFELTHKKTGISAQAREIDGDFVVLAGSLAVPTWISKAKANAAHSYSKLQQKLMDNGQIQAEEATGRARFTEDVAFSSPSAASAVILGRSDNGRLSWKVQGTQTNYAAWQDAQIETAEAAASGEVGAPPPSN
jgi:hypothetical protein